MVIKSFILNILTYLVNIDFLNKNSIENSHVIEVCLIHDIEIINFYICSYLKKFNCLKNKLPSIRLVWDPGKAIVKCKQNSNK